MTKYLFVITTMLFIAGCTYKPKQNRLAEFEDNNKNIIRSFYKIESDTIKYFRILKNRNDYFTNQGRIYHNEHYITEQTLDSIIKIPNNEKTIDSLTLHFNKNGLNEINRNEELVMFIQIVPDTGMTSFEYFKFMHLRHKIENKIDRELQSAGIGQWVAGDMGAGANMLFSTKSWNVAFLTVLEILRKERILDNVLITKRIITSKDDWNYEIVYPIEYEGVFNSF